MSARPSGRLLALLTLNFGVVFLDRYSLSFLIPFAAVELGLSNARVGLLSSATALAWAVSGLVLSVALARRLSSKHSLLLLSMVTTASALATGLAGSFGALLAARITAGASGGPVMPLSQAVMGGVSGSRHRGLQMGVMQSLGPGMIGVVVGPVMLVAVALALGWRVALCTVALVGLLTTWLLAQYLQIPPVVSSAAHDSLAQAATLTPAPTRRLLQYPNLRRCGVISVAMIGWLLTSMTFYPLYLVREAHISAVQMGAVMTAFGAGGACGGVLLPHLSDYIGRRAAVVGGALLGLIAPLMLLHLPHSVPLTAVAMFLSALCGGTNPLCMGTIPVESLPREQSHAGMGLVQALGESLGGVIVPFACGLLADHFGLRSMLLVLIGCAVVAAAAAAGLTEAAVPPSVHAGPPSKKNEYVI